MSPIDVHASAVVIEEAGILIRGASGSGKSSLALALIAAAESAGSFARLVGDDRIGLESRGGRLIARGHPLILGRIEQRGQGILPTPFVAAAIVRLVVDLVPPDRTPPRCPEPEEDRLLLAGVSLPLLILRQSGATCDLAASTLRRLRLTRH
ncbi:MAG: aldolase [Methylocella sp.]